MPDEENLMPLTTTWCALLHKLLPEVDQSLWSKGHWLCFFPETTRLEHICYIDRHCEHGLLEHPVKSTLNVYYIFALISFSKFIRQYCNTNTLVSLITFSVKLMCLFFIQSLAWSVWRNHPRGSPILQRPSLQTKA